LNCSMLPTICFSFLISLRSCFKTLTKVRAGT
jgi:hypothetical protein